MSLVFSYFNHHIKNSLKYDLILGELFLYYTQIKRSQHDQQAKRTVVLGFLATSDDSFTSFFIKFNICNTLYSKIMSFVSINPSNSSNCLGNNVITALFQKNKVLRVDFSLINLFKCFPVFEIFTIFLMYTRFLQVQTDGLLHLCSSFVIWLLLFICSWLELFVLACCGRDI